jgi:hypothetical protein
MKLGLDLILYFFRHIHADMRTLESEFLDLTDVETQIKTEIAEAIWDDVLREVRGRQSGMVVVFFSFIMRWLKLARALFHSVCNNVWF